MQALWAKVLAGEANTPGTYARRTVNFVATLEKKEAAHFCDLCRFAWDMGTPRPLVFDVRHTLYTDNGVTFGTLTHLDNIGLIRFDSLAGYRVEVSGGGFLAAYFDNVFAIGLAREKPNHLPLGHVLLTQVGVELTRILEVKPVAGFADFVRQRWQESGATVTPVVARRVPSGEKS